MSDIPNDIILQILQRIPAGSLIRFRWACKYWFDLITRDDDDFVKMHRLLHQSTQSTVSCHSVLISKEEDDDTEKLFKSYLNYNTGEGKEEEETSSSSPVRIAFPFEPHRFKVLGSCNGLILLRTEEYRLPDRNFLWNPCTSEYKVIPDPPVKVNSITITYGLGYDNTLDDYKVIRIIYNFVCSGHDIQVYTLGTNSWKTICVHVSNDIYLWLAKGVFANGALYWLDPDYGKIFSFDIVKEKFQKVPMSIPQEWNMRVLQLQQFEGSLYVNSYDDISNSRVEMWIMNKDSYGVVNNDKCSWTKLYTYRAYDRPSSSQSDSFRQLRFTKNGGMLILKDTRYLCLCGSNNDRTAICCPHCSVKELYIESLVSLKSGMYLYESRKEKNKEQHKEKPSRRKRSSSSIVLT